MATSTSSEKEIEAFKKLVLNVTTDWLVFRDLFTKPENYTLFQNSGIGAWHHLKNALIESIIMGVSRLLDPPISCGKDNLSINKLKEKITFSQTTNQKLDELKSRFQSVFKTWRNKKLGHNDYDVAMRSSSIPGFQYSELEGLVKDLAVVAKWINLDLENGDTDFFPNLSGNEWSYALIQKLKE